MKNTPLLEVLEPLTHTFILTPFFKQYYIIRCNMTGLIAFDMIFFGNNNIVLRKLIPEILVCSNKRSLTGQQE